MTKIELVIAISVLIIIGNFSFVNLDIKEYEINSAIEQLVSDIRYVRQISTMNNVDSYIEINVNDETKEYGYTLKEDGKIKKQIILPEGSDIWCDRTTIKFSSLGTPNRSASTIDIIYNEKVNKITITPVSGRVLFKE